MKLIKHYFKLIIIELIASGQYYISSLSNGRRTCNYELEINSQFKLACSVASKFISVLNETDVNKLTSLLS